MDKQFYRSLLPLVNDKDQHQTLKDYADRRIKTMHSLLETTKDHNRILEGKTNQKTILKRHKKGWATVSLFWIMS